MNTAIPAGPSGASLARIVGRDGAAGAREQRRRGGIVRGISRSRGAVVRPQEPTEALPALDAIRGLDFSDMGHSR